MITVELYWFWFRYPVSQPRLFGSKSGKTWIQLCISKQVFYEYLIFIQIFYVGRLKFAITVYQLIAGCFVTMKRKKERGKNERWMLHGKVESIH